MGDLVYNVADVRVLDYDSPSAAPYLVDTARPTKGNGFLGVFLRVYNLGTKPQRERARATCSSRPSSPASPSRIWASTTRSRSRSARPFRPAASCQSPARPRRRASSRARFLLYPINDETVKDQPFDLVIHDPLTGQLANLRLPIVKL